MKLFLDTSALLKLYNNEVGSDEMEVLFSSNKIEKIYLSSLTILELESAIRKKMRMNELTEDETNAISRFFSEDYSKFTWVEINEKVLKRALSLLKKYGTEGLRTLDAIQLSSAIEVKNDVDLNVTYDKLLKRLFELEGLNN
jgi:predicted nucleic acid-binding protein